MIVKQGTIDTLHGVINKLTKKLNKQRSKRKRAAIEGQIAISLGQLRRLYACRKKEKLDQTPPPGNAPR